MSGYVAPGGRDVGSGSRRIFIVDDDPDFLEALTDLLKFEAGFDVGSATSSSEASRAAAQFMPDLALIDITLGGNSGLELVPELKEALPDVPCLIITGRHDEESAIEAMRSGADDYLHKPIEPTALLHTLQQHLNRRELEQDKSEAERRFHAVFDQAFQSVFLLSDEGTVLDANETARRLSSGEAGKLIGQPLWAGAWWGGSQETRERLEAAVNEARGGRVARFEADLSAATGEADTARGGLSLDMSFKPVMNRAGQVGLILAEGRDITDRKRAEEALQHAYDDLEERIQQRTHDLVKARDEAERASLAKSDFLSRMSHELRTPLTTIVGFAELIAAAHEHAPEAAEAKFTSNILRAATHLRELIDEVLDLAKIEAGHVELDVEKVRLSDALKDSLYLVRSTAEGRDIRIQDDVSEQSDLVVIGDRKRLKQVFINLLSNAVKYNDAGGEVRISSEKTGNQRLRIYVSDNGPGIPESEHARLFEPFEQLQTGSDSQGTGIGLAVTKQLVLLMNGKIGIESEVGSGSRFWFELDCEDDGAEEKAEPAPAPPAEAGNAEKTLLYVEDYPDNLELMARIVAMHPNWTLLTANTGAKGLEVAAEAQPDLILLDIGLPEMTGWEVLAKLREREETKDIPVIALSANAMPEDVEKGLASGFEAYLTKPFEISTIRQVLDRFSAPPSADA